MQKISELTKKQESIIPEYVQRYTSIGRSTERIDKVAANKYARDLMKFLGRDFIACVCTDGPKAAWEAVLILSEVERLLEGEKETVPDDSVRLKKIESQVMSQVRSQVWSQVWSQVGSQVHSQVHSQVWSQVESQVSSQVWSQVGSQVWSQVRSQMWSQVELQIRSQVELCAELIWPYLDGQFWASYAAYCRFLRDIVGIDLPNTSIIDDLFSFGNIYPLSRFVVISDRMSACHTNEHGLHKDLAPAVEYLDGTKIWCLNGVNVPQWLVETPRHKIDPSKFATIENVEVRREFVRKVGVEAICSGSKVLDHKGDYELLLVDLKGETGLWPYLKMLNPSIKVWHVEAVDKSCDTVEKALQWRNQSEKVPDIIT